jgi:hypothetical protein
MDPNAQFCRILLAQARKDLTGREAEHLDEHAGVLRIDRKTFLFEWSGADSADPGVKTFATEIEADNAAHAKAQGIQEWLVNHAAALRALDWPPRR